MAGAAPESRLLVVLGATGTQGGAVLRYFARQSSQLGFRLRGVTRNAGSKAAKDLQALGVDMVEADLEEPASLQRAFLGATHIFANTDSNQIIFNAIKNPQILGPGEDARTYAQKREMKMGENIANAAAATESLQRIVWSSLASPKKWTKGRYTKVTMFDAKEDIADLLKAKTELQDKLSILLVGFYAENAVRVPDVFAPKKQQDGIFELALPMSGDVRLPQADVESDSGKWISALFDAKPGIVLVGATECLSWKEWLEMWGSHNGVKTRYREAPPEEYAGKIPGLSEALAEEYQFMEHYGFTGGNSEAVYPEEDGRQHRAIENRRPDPELRLVKHLIAENGREAAVAVHELGKTVNAEFFK
ncbi:MAG: hypothetical protein M1821_000715 [Bathelium mastoideum]|nr:MAG: hypothetical protein M1821_000715 [Bathelium mastoideum]